MKTIGNKKKDIGGTSASRANSMQAPPQGAPASNRAPASASAQAPASTYARTQRQRPDGKTRRRRKGEGGSFAPKAAIAVVIFLAALVAFSLFLGQAGLVDMQTKEQGAETLRQTIIDAAVQCYAIEGSYPQSLDYLKENYGVVVGDGYSVVYEIYAPNEMPTIIVGDANE